MALPAMFTLRRKNRSNRTRPAPQQCNANFQYSPDYGTANKNEARRYLKTYGLAPPGVDSYENQMKRCEAQS